jgi:predicted DNA-binding transcriptional regulator AlpA
MPKKHFCRLPEVQARYDCSRSKVYESVQRGLLPKRRSSSAGITCGTPTSLMQTTHG